jgi:NAD+ kinase
MAELDVSEEALISEFFSGRFFEEKRMTLKIEIDGKTLTALNDAAFHSHSTHMIRLCLSCNGNTVNSYRGDGLIFATPTGSTAYSMSAGGPVIDPSLECIEITPVCTQSLMARPLIFSPDSVLTVIVDTDDCILTVDGGSSVKLDAKSEVRISRGERSLRMIKLKKDGFYGVLRRKFYE